MANNTKLILHFFFLFIIVVVVVIVFFFLSFVFHFACSLFFTMFLLCRCCALSSLFLVSLLAKAFYYLLQWSNVNAIRPRMSRIIYMNFTLHCFFFSSYHFSLAFLSFVMRSLHATQLIVAVACWNLRIYCTLSQIHKNAVVD